MGLVISHSPEAIGCWRAMGSDFRFNSRDRAVAGKNYPLERGTCLQAVIYLSGIGEIAVGRTRKESPNNIDSVLSPYPSIYK